MRQRLNSNPLAQVAVIGVLLVAVGFLVLSSMGGGEGESSSTTTSTTASSSAGGSASVSATVTTPESGSSPAAASTSSSPAAAPEVPAPRLPSAVRAAYAANQTVVLLIFKEGGIDDRMVARATARLESLPNVSSFVVPAHKIARYTAITQGLQVNRVPALIVMRPKRLDRGIPAASVSYGYQSPESVVQAVHDADYKGHTLSYHP